MNGENSLLGRPLRASPFVTGLESFLTGRQRQILSRTCTSLRAAFPPETFYEHVCDKLGGFVKDVERFRTLLRITRAVVGGKLPQCIRYCGPDGGAYGRYFSGRRDVVTIYVEPARVSMVEMFFLEEQDGWIRVQSGGPPDVCVFLKKKDVADKF